MSQQRILKRKKKRKVQVFHYQPIKASQSIDNKFDEAKISLNHLIKEFPAYSPEAKYYYVFAIAKTAEGKLQYKEAEQLLREAKNGFENRLARFAENINIVESHKTADDHNIFENDVFLQQQQDLERLTLLIIESINKFFGQRIESSDFYDEGFCEEGALIFYKHFTNSTFYGTNLPIIDSKIESNIDKDRLNIYCQYHGLDVIEVIEKLNEVQINGATEIKNLFKILQIATWEEFWVELEKKKVVIDIKKHLFCNTSKMPKLSHSKIHGCIIPKTERKLFQHQFVNEKEWEELDTKKVKEIISTELFNILIENYMLVECESGVLASVLPIKVNFEQFNKISKNNLAFYGIQDEEVDEIFENLMANGIIESIDNEFYTLGSNFDIDKCFESWYGNNIIKMIEQKLAFSLAYHNLRLGLYPILPNENDKDFIAEFTKAGILEKTNVNIIGLKTNPITTGIISNQWESLRNTVQDRNITLALDIVKQFIQQNFGKEHAKHLTENVFCNHFVEKVKGLFRENAAMAQKFDTFDINLVPINENVNSDEICINSLNGLSHLIEFCGKRWTKRTKLQLSVVTAAAISQILAGGVMFAITSGFGALPATAFMAEGAGDLLYVAKGVFTGYCESYIKHKAISVALNVSLCGIGSIGYAENLQPLYQKSLNALKTAFNKKELVANASINFIKQASGPLVTLMWRKITRSQDMAKIVMDATKFAVLQTNFKINKILETFFSENSKHYQLITIIKGMLKTMGINEKNSINFAADKMFTKSIDPVFKKICIFIIFEFRQSIMKNKDVTKTSTFETKISEILSSNEFQKLTTLLQGKLELCIFQLQSIFDNKLLREKGSKYGIDVMIDKPINMNADDREENQEITETANNLLFEWESNLKERSEALIEKEVMIPLDYDNEKQYQNMLNSIKLEAYSKFRKQKNGNFEVIENSIIQAKKAETLEEQMLNDFKVNYYQKLQHLQNITRDPEIYVKIVNDTAMIDRYGENFISASMSNKLGKTVAIKNSEEIAQTVKTVETPPVKIIIQRNDDEKVDTNLSMYHQLIKEMPEIQRYFENNEEFENQLIQNVKNDDTFYLRQNSLQFNDLLYSN